MVSQPMKHDAADRAGPMDFAAQPMIPGAVSMVLTPLSHPELAPITMDDNLFAIGRMEFPFVSYAPDLVADLSRRHARIFFEYGAVYIADLDSKNGTTVNGIHLRQQISRLQQGDEICFGRTLSYRVALGAGAQQSARPLHLISLTLEPERSDLGLQPIVVSQFPFLISKADAVFSRYREAYPHQVNYLSRRHAHVFLKGGTPFVEDLGSTNGTFVGTQRLDEHARALHDGDVVAFGGHHFIYKISLQYEVVESDPTVTKLGPATLSPASVGPTQSSSPISHVAHADGDIDKTTFVAAAGSFLDIFCIDSAQPQDDEINQEVVAPDTADTADAKPRPPRGKFALLAAQLRTAFAGSERMHLRRAAIVAASLMAALVTVVAVVHHQGAPERTLRDLLARGDNAQAAAFATQVLARYPDHVELRALATEAHLKATVPPWVQRVKTHAFDQARAMLAGVQQAGAHNADLASLASELAWIGDLEQFIVGRGGLEAPIRIYVDEGPIKALLQRWNDDPGTHQRSLARIVGIVPEFSDLYAEALSHLRKLQSDEAVYLAAIDRLKTAINDALSRDQPETLVAVLDDVAEKYPRIGGLDTLREDLRRYTEIDAALRAGGADSVAALMANTTFSTMPFQEKLRALKAEKGLPVKRSSAADTIESVQIVSSASGKGSQ